VLRSAYVSVSLGGGAVGVYVDVGYTHSAGLMGSSDSVIDKFEV